MGTEWYIFDNDKREYFELGKGPWGRDTITVINSDYIPVGMVQHHQPDT